MNVSVFGCLKEPWYKPKLPKQAVCVTVRAAVLLGELGRGDGLCLWAAQPGRGSDPAALCEMEGRGNPAGLPGDPLSSCECQGTSFIKMFLKKPGNGKIDANGGGVFLLISCGMERSLARAGKGREVLIEHRTNPEVDYRDVILPREVQVC